MEQLALNTETARPPVWGAGRVPARGQEPTERMVEYLADRANGLTQKETARHLGLSVPGARRLDAESRERLAAATTAQAVAAAIARGLLVAGCLLLVAALQVAELAQLTGDLPAVARRAPGKRRVNGERGGHRGGRGGGKKGGRAGDGGPLSVATGPDWGAIGRPGPGLAADDLATQLADEAANLPPATQAHLAAAAEREALAWT